MIHVSLLLPNRVERPHVTDIVCISGVSIGGTQRDFDRIPNSDIPMRKGADGLNYRFLRFDIQVTYYSAYTTYELFRDDINYGSVTAEYV